MSALKKFLIVVACLFLFVWTISSLENAITIDKAMERFYETTGSKDIVVVRHSNMSFFFGNPHDVTFELKIDGKPVSARCTSGVFSAMVCRIYDDGE